MRSSKLCTAILLPCLASAVVLASASAQTATWELNPNEPLEKYDMPPAYIYRLETGPRMVSPYGGFISYQVNVDANGNNILGDAANEPSIAVDPTNPNRMTIGWRQFNTVSSNFRQGGWGNTTDGGVHWTFPGVLENSVFRSDPVLYSNETGTFFYLSLLQTFCENIYRSTNGGQSWTELQADGLAGGGDKEWFTIDRTNGMGHGFQYQAWSPAATCAGGLFSRSTNGGVTWQSPINLPNSAHWGTLDVASNGYLFIGGGDERSSFWCVRSTNAQNPGVTPTFDQVTTVNLGGGLVGGNINPVGLTGQIFLWVDRSGGPTNNNIYMLASVRPPSYTNGTDVNFVRSTDGGVTFSTPHRINDDATTDKWHWFGTFSVAPNGRLDAVWYDTRNDPGNLLSQLFYSYSTDGGVTWSANVAVSQPFDPTQGWPQQNKIGDYITIVSDNTGGNVAYSATFNFNPNTGQHEEDIYYVRVSPMPTSYLGNTSTRAFVQTGDNVMIGGFIVQGTGTKRVIIRAIGPELNQYGVPNPLQDPTFELHDGNGALIASNDNWQTTIIGGIIMHDQVQEIQNSGHAPGDSRESAIIADLIPGNYTAIVRGVNNMTGVALVEVYDLSPNTNSILGNISTRSFVQTGDNVMIGGFIVQGTTPKRVIIRAIGPELSQYGVPNPLADPTLELHNGTGALIATNDNWQHTIIGGIITHDQVQEIQNSGHAPGDPSESAIIATLPAGNYTAIVRGKNIIVGVALVEVYDLN